MIPKTDESIIQENTIDLLISMGYKFITQNNEKREKYKEFKSISKYRSNTNQVILKDVLLERLQSLNGFSYKNIDYKFSNKNIAKAIEDIDYPLNEGLMTANQHITDQLVLGKSYLEELVDGVKKSFSLKYIDFKNPENNIFHFTEEFVVNRVVKNEKVKTRKPDLVLFINGIAFAVIELKKSSIDTQQGISQMLRNQGEKEIPQLFKYVQITLAGNNHSPKYATTGTPKKFYAVWNEKSEKNCHDLITDRTPSKLDDTIYSLFEKNRVIELIHSFIIFDNKVKKIARYQQYFAIQKIRKRIEKIDNKGIRAGGLIWHTQGSGKSLTMIMLAKVIKREIINLCLTKKFKVYEGNCVSYGSSLSYYPWTQILNNLFGILSSDITHIRKKKIWEKVKEVKHIPKGWLPLIGEPIGVKFQETSLTKFISAKMRKQKIFELIFKLLKYEVKKMPLLIVIEDFQWSDSLNHYNSHQ